MNIGNMKRQVEELEVTKGKNEAMRYFKIVEVTDAKIRECKKKKVELINDYTIPSDAMKRRMKSQDDSIKRYAKEVDRYLKYLSEFIVVEKVKY